MRMRTQSYYLHTMPSLYTAQTLKSYRREPYTDVHQEYALVCIRALMVTPFSVAVAVDKKQRFSVDNLVIGVQLSVLSIRTA